MSDPAAKPPQSSADTVRDLLGLAGIALMSYGAWLIYQPAGFITAGVTLFLMAMASTLLRLRRRQPPSEPRA